MAKIGNQIQYEKNNGGLEVIIYPSITRTKLNMLYAWGAAWTVCGLIILVSLFTYDYQKEEYLMVSIFMLFWGYFEYKIIYALQWNTKGKEVLKINDGAFTYLKQIGKRGLPIEEQLEKMYPFKHIEEEQKGFISDVNNSSWMVGGEVIEYTYDGSVKRIGMKLLKKDAVQLVKLLNKTARF